MRRLLTIEDTFIIRALGLVVVPAPPVAEVQGPGDLDVELRLPGGQRPSATLTLLHQSITPPPTMRRWGCTFRTLDKEDVPIGTEVWCAESAFVPPGAPGAG
jgi:hypothetical protein